VPPRRLSCPLSLVARKCSPRKRNKIKRIGGGRPRQRLLANLHGEPDVLRALARLSLQRMQLLEERHELKTKGVASVLDEDDEWLQTRTPASLQRELIQRIDAQLPEVDAELRILKRHCPANAEQISAAIEAYRRELETALAMAMGAILVTGQHETAAKKAKATLKRMRGF
jgi:hypothetical protein